ncbi:MAG: hypothetical protein WB817_19990 [Terriglobales bacterium]
MSENGGSAIDMKEVSSTSFGYLIGFLLPGLLGLYSISYWLPQVGVLFQPISSANAAVGPSVILLLIAVGMGLCVSAVRHFLLVQFLYNWILKKKVMTKEMYQGLDSNKLAWHKTLAEEHYRYHQFYGGCAVAVMVMFAGWAWNYWKIDVHFGRVLVGFMLVEALFMLSASDTHDQYVGKCDALIGGETPQSKGQ